MNQEKFSLLKLVFTNQFTEISIYEPGKIAVYWN